MSNDKQEDIVDFISKYVKLEKISGNYKGICPFHNEDTPSFVVSISKQMFHCFGCGETGSLERFKELIANKEDDVQ